MAEFQLQILSPDKVLFDGKAENLIVRTTVGDKGFLANHEPYVAALGVGRLKVKQDGEFRSAAVSSGIVRFRDNKAQILAQSVEWKDEIDVTRAEAAKERAEQELQQELSDKELDMTEFDLKRALNRINVVKFDY
ncbi:MAG: ATP synthase F1 subunit epsilon [Oscillospiraceae bacterium]|jgi:F-type H+-transporting ATPase subunit epsilon|nr:ATP synthase F1 subunit epsilon [Oscillospiraceae bacterium]